MEKVWYSELEPVERRTFWACFAGFGLDSMDSSIYALVIPALIATIGITRPEAGYLATAALAGAAVGGWSAGVSADRFGRVRILQVTILWVALCTFASAFANGFSTLLTLRFLQGLGYGGEAAVGATLISEVIRPEMRGRVASAVSSSYAVGYAISVALLPAISSLFPQELGWRIFFGLGIIPAAVVFFVRRLVPESGVFKQSIAGGTAAPPFWAIFAGAQWRRTVAAAVMSTGIFGGNYVLIIWLPTYLRTALNFSIATSAGYLAANISGSFVGPLLYGWLSDRVGRRPAFVTFLLLQICNVSVFLFATPSAGLLIIPSFLLGAFQNALASGMTPTFAELFPTSLRANGQGFCLGGGRGFGSVVPAAVGIVAVTLPLGTAMGLCALSAYAVAFCATFALPETSGADLHEEAPDESRSAAQGAQQPAIGLQQDGRSARM